MSARPKRAELKRWLEQQTITLLPAHEQIAGVINKAGLLPFIRSSSNCNEWRFLVMRPRGEHPELGPPPLQICKGTRMGKLSGKWRDMARSDTLEKYSDVESLPFTAMREGIEELGVRLDGITQLFDAGPAIFTSAKSGDAKTMHLLLAEMQDETALLPMDMVDASTAERRWMDILTFDQEGRTDHTVIIKRLFVKIINI